MRRMFEQFFGNAFRINPYDSKAQIEFNRGTRPSSIVKEEEPFIDVIELENEIMIVVSTNEHIQNPEAKITEGLLRLRENPLKIFICNCLLKSQIPQRGDPFGSPWLKNLPRQICMSDKKEEAKQR